MTNTRNNLYGLAFFITGVAGLMAESVWQQYFAIAGGGETQAAAIVLAVMMGGAALGAYLVGRAGPSYPLKTFAKIEFGIGFWCILFPLVFIGGKEIFFVSLSLFGDGGFGLFVSRLLLAVFTILPPAILSGASFPLLSAGVAGQTSFTKKVAVPAWLYAINAAGGMSGALFAGFILVPAVGLHGVMLIAGSLDLLAGLGVALLARRENVYHNCVSPNEQSGKHHAPRVQLGTHRDSQHPHFTKRLVLVFLAGTGAVIFAFEITYFRILAQILDSSAQSFTLMLAVCIGGLALGGAISARLIARGVRPVYFAWQQLALMVLMLVSLLILDRMPWLLLQLRDGLTPDTAGYASWLLQRVFIASLVMLPVAIMAGLSFPVLLHFSTMQDLSVSKISRGWMWNVLGTVIGSLMAALVLVPLMGTRKSIVLLAGLSLVMGVVAFRAAHKNLSSLRARALPLVGCVVFVLLVFLAGFVSGKDSLFGLAWSVESNPFRSYEEYTRSFSEHAVLYHREDAELVVSVTTHYDARRRRGLALTNTSAMPSETRTLRVNGKPDASDNINDMSTQLLLAHVPLLLQANPERVAIVGLGSGTTTGAALAHPAVQRVDSIELSPAVVQASHLFSSVNREYHKDARSHVSIRDAGIHFIKRPSHYDVIISEPSHPWMAGVSRLFTQGFFSLCRKSLTDSGIMTQWVHVAGLSDTTLSRILATFESVFPDSSIWMSNNGDLLLVGWKGNRHLPENVVHRMSFKSVQEQMAVIGIEDLDDFLLREMTRTASVLQGQNLQVFDAFFPELASIAPREMFTRQQATIHISNDLRLRGTGLLFSDARLGVQTKDARVMTPFLRYVILQERNFQRVQAVLSRMPEESHDSGILAALAEYQYEAKDLDQALFLWQRVLARDAGGVWKIEYADFLLSSMDQRVDQDRARLRTAILALEIVQQDKGLASRAAWIQGQGFAKLGEFARAEKSAMMALSYMTEAERKGINAGHVYVLLAGVEMMLASDPSDRLGRESRLELARSMLEQAALLDPENRTGARQVRKKLETMLRQGVGP